MYDAALFDLFGTLVTERGQAICGAYGLLAGLPDARWAIVTSCPRGLAAELLRRARLPVPQVLVTADDVRENKPAPDGYLHAASRLSFQPPDCVVFEDSTAGIRAARAAGMAVINVRETPLESLALEVAVDGRLRLRR